MHLLSPSLIHSPTDSSTRSPLTHTLTPSLTRLLGASCQNSTCYVAERVSAARLPTLTLLTDPVRLFFSVRRTRSISNHISELLGSERKPGASLYARKRLSHGGQGESLVPTYTRGSVSVSWGPGRKPGASLYTRNRLSPVLSHWIFTSLGFLLAPLVKTAPAMSLSGCLPRGCLYRRCLTIPRGCSMSVCCPGSISNHIH
jgi:hypothetical protein